MSCGCGAGRAMMNERERDLDDSAPIWFSFAGAKVIVVKGGATGRIYRFVPGSRLRVHAGDAPSMRAIPGLRRQDGSLLRSGT
ncbi:MAG TPA: hypothetical protein VIY49_24805 [Bryobacteraceae bacterium]